MATMRMYCPSLKKNVEAIITDGKRVASKGGSLRNIIYGEYEGRKCLPKTVKAEVFAQHGFAAESKGESATYEPSQEPEGSTPATEPTNANFEAEGDWCPECSRDWKHLLKEGHGPDCSLAAETESFCSSCGSHKRAEGCGCMAAETFEAETPIPLPKDEEGDICDGCDKEGEFQTWAYNHGAFCKECIERIKRENADPTLHAEYDFQNRAITTVEADNKDDAYEGLAVSDLEDEDWVIVDVREAEDFEEEKSTCRCGKDIANQKCKMCGSSICSDCDGYYYNNCIECFGSRWNAESSPSSFDISWEDAQGVSSPSLPPEGIHFAEQGKNIKFCNGCNKRTNFEDGECNFCAFPEYGAEGEYSATMCDSCEAIYPEDDEGDVCECGGTIRNLYEYEDGSADFESEYRLNSETCEHCAEEVQLNAEGFCSECYEDLYLSETMAAEGISRNGKLVLGLTALGVGMAMALGSERVASLLDKLNRK